MTSLAVWAGSARAQEDEGSPPKRTGVARSVCLEWAAGTSSECSSTAEIETAIRAMMSRAVRLSAPCQVRVAASFHPDAEGGWKVDLHFQSEAGESLGSRTLVSHAAECSALAEPLSLVVALMLEGNASSSSALRLPPPPAPPSATMSMNGVAVSAGAVVSSGLLPDVGFGATLGVASRLIAGLPLRLDTTFWLHAAGSTSQPGGQFWAWLGGVGFCPFALRWGRIDAGPCVRASAGVLRGVGLGLNQTAAATRLYGDGEVSLTVSARLSGGGAIYVTAALAFPWTRSPFVYRTADETRVQIHEPSAVIPLAGVGLMFGANDARPRRAAQ